jgi:hypothetical protein
MPRARATPPPVPSKRERIKRLILGIVYLLSISGLIVWEYRDHIEAFSPSCETHDNESKPAYYSIPYKRLLGWASGERTSQVSEVAIPLDLDDIQHNYCQARMYTADLLRTIATQHPAEVVIDKFYSPTSCLTTPQATQELKDVVRSLPLPVIVGESTNKVPTCDDSCLARKPQMDFGSSNVLHGITRLNQEAEKIPLQWRILPSEGKDVKAVPADSLSWTAVKAYDPTFAKGLPVLLDPNRQPYAHLTIHLPRQTSTELLCAYGTAAMRKRWSVNCTGPVQHLNLLGKVVLIGSEDTGDYWPVLSSHMWGFDIQARYIQAILSGNYLSALPVWIDFVLFAFFIFVIEGLPTLMEAYRPHWKKHPLLSRAFHRQRYVWVLFWTVGFLFLTGILSLACRYLPPLAVFGDIVLVVITRLLFFAAESTEAPLLHTNTKGHHGTHSSNRRVRPEH